MDTESKLSAESKLLDSELPSSDAAASSASLGATALADPASSGAVASGQPPLFDEFYDDWAAFDSAIARAVAKNHPIRKRSSVTFEVYNRTVSKGRHDRKNIAEFLSKTFKCTHGIKFRSRSSGKRARHKLRDIGCPFHVYATAVEFGATYRVRVRVHEQHNHPLGPDAIKAIAAMRETDFEMVQDNEGASTSPALGEATVVLESATSAEVPSPHLDGIEQLAPPAAQDAAVFTHALQSDGEQMQVSASATVQQSAVVQQAYEQDLPQEQHGHAQVQVHGAVSQPLQSGQAGILDADGHDSEALLASAIQSSMEEQDFIARAPPAVTVSAETNQRVGEASHPPPKFEPTLTFEALRKRVADFRDEREWNQFHTPRNLLLALTGEVGELCEIFQWKGECKTVDDWPASEKEHLGEELSDVLIYLVLLADKCNVDLPAALNDKIIKNGIKYPAALVKGSSKKYNECKRMRLDSESVSWQSSHESEGVLTRAIESTMGEQSSVASAANGVDHAVESSEGIDEAAFPKPKFEPTYTLEALRQRQVDFAEERGWYEGHTIRNLLLALTGELGELCEIFQWKNECATVDDWPAREKEHLGEELSDVTIYLVQMADKCNVDMPAALNDKILKNEAKYPAAIVKGSSKKYNEY